MTISHSTRQISASFQCIILIILNVGTRFALTTSEHGVIEVPGDIIIGGLFPLHKKSIENENVCGNFSEVPGYQYMSAMLFEIEEVNNDPDILQNITLGAQIYDTCQSKTIANEAAKQFIKATLIRESAGQLAGVIGAMSSGVSETVANFLRVFEIPQISYASTSITLSNKDIYSYFLRVVAPDTFQAQAMVDIIKRFGWNYVATVNSAGTYGTKGMEEFWKAAERNGICIDIKESFTSAFPTIADYEDTIKRVFERAQQSNVSVIVVFGTQTVIRHLLEAALKFTSRAPRHFTWIGSDGWSNRPVVETAEKAALGALTIMVRTGTVPQKFKDHFSSFNLTNYPLKNKRYFYEFWENRFRCKLTEHNGSWSRVYDRNCYGNESLKNVAIDYSPVRVVINSVKAYALALNSLQKELCPNQTGVCPNMTSFDRTMLLEHLQNVTFSDPLANTTLKFDKNYEVSGMYDIINFRKQDGVGKYVRVGTWDGEIIDGQIVSNFVLDRNISWLKGESSPPASYCSENCFSDQTKMEIHTFDFKCCWKCKTCSKLQIVVNNSCKDGPEGWVPNSDRNGWVKRRLVYQNLNDDWSIAMIFLSVVALLLTLGVTIMYIVHKDNRLLKATGRELCFVMLAGIAMCFLVPVLFIAKPADSVCYTRNVFTGLALAMCYAPLFMKVNRIYRIFTSAKSTIERPALVTPRMQILITFGLVTVQLLFTALWMTAKPVKAQEIYYSDSSELVLECTADLFGFAGNLSFVMILMLLCTVYAFKTREFPKNFNESKYIGVTMYVTCAVWVIFFPFYFNSTHRDIHPTLVSGVYVIIGLVTLFGLFGHKVYVVFRVHDLRNEDLLLSTRSRQKNANSTELNSKCITGVIK
ncbi:metabotropic glutamate receptor 4-like [Dendronephthya gigantea]|uniref:metabotropic glutamate receptor 4-like n=1 Tax=Dendronephthya gigantea TaxID=151771 RepID=UPI00106AE5A9|nr:metabotropic glutamate receptor 4-like [Dendronephthya gigantea]